MAKWYEKLGSEIQDIGTKIPIIGGLFGETPYEEAARRLGAAGRQGMEKIEAGKAAATGYMMPYQKAGEEAMGMHLQNIRGGAYATPIYTNPEEEYAQRLEGKRVGVSPVISQLTAEEFAETPGYKARMEASQEAIDRLSAAGRIPGGYSGTAAAEQLLQSSQDIASQEFARQDEIKRGLAQQNWENMLKAQGIDYGRDVGDYERARARGVQDWQMERTGVQDLYKMLSGETAEGRRTAAGLGDLEMQTGKTLADILTDVASAQAGVSGAEAAETTEALGAIAGAFL